MNNKPESSQTRRKFVQGSTAVAGVAAASVASITSAAQGHAASKEIQTDVLVCGGGCAGTAAALSAARNGAKVLLVEKAPFAGGIITNVGLPYFDGIAHITTKRVVVRGIALELLSKSGVCEPNAEKVYRHNPTIPSTFEMKILLDRLFQKEKDNLTVLYNSFVCDVETTDDQISAVKIANKDGLVTIRPKVVIDCTGDADVAAWGGAPFEQNEEVQPLTLHFRIGNVQRLPGVHKQCRAAVDAAQKRGDLPMYYGPGVQFLFAKDEAYIHGVRVPADPTDAADLSRAEIQGRADSYAMFLAWKCDVPAFKDSYFIEAYPWIGVRESRRLIGQHILSEDDLMKGRRFNDAIATGCWYLDLHPNKVVVGSANDFDPKKVQPEPYDIPYRSLLPKKVANLLAAGRCHSATRGAHASTRVTATAMALGEAAGQAGFMAVKESKSPQELDGGKVREVLAVNGGGPFTNEG